MRARAIELSKIFLKYIKGFEEDGKNNFSCPSSYQNAVIKNSEELLLGKTNDLHIKEALRLAYKEKLDSKQFYNIEDVLRYYKKTYSKKEREKNDNNLIDPNRFYYHSALQIVPGPPTVTQNKDGTFVASYDEEPFFLEIKESFTIEDLTDYFIRKGDISDHEKSRFVGAFKHLTSSYELDHILFTIDEAFASYEDHRKKKPKGPFEVMEYQEEGRAIWEDRKEMAYMEGIDYVIPRLQ